MSGECARSQERGGKHGQGHMVCRWIRNPSAKTSREAAVMARAGVPSEVSVIVDGLWYPLPYGALKRCLHVCKATGRCPENCLPLSHYCATNSHLWYARRCLE